MMTMVKAPKKRQENKQEKHDIDVFEEYVGYLGKGNTDKTMRELRGDPEIDIDEP